MRGVRDGEESVLSQEKQLCALEEELQVVRREMADGKGGGACRGGGGKNTCFEQPVSSP